MTKKGEQQQSEVAPSTTTNPTTASSTTTSSASSSSCVSTNRKTLSSSTCITSAPFFSAKPSHSNTAVLSHHHSSSFRSNSTSRSRSTLTDHSSIKKTNSFSSLDSSTITTNSISSKAIRASSTLTKATHSKHTKPNHSVLELKFPLDNSTKINKPVPDFSSNSNEQEPTKRLKFCNKLRNNAIAAKFSELLDNSQASASDIQTEPLIVKCETITDTSHSDPFHNSLSCSNSEQNRSDKEDNKVSNSNQETSSFLDNESSSSFETSNKINSDMLARLNLNKDDITDDSDESDLDNKSSPDNQSKFPVINMTPEQGHSSSSFPKLISDQPVNYALTFPQSSFTSAMNLAESSSLRGELNKGQLGSYSLSRSIRNSATTAPLKNSCQMHHRASMSNNDLHLSSSNHGLGHRSLYASYNTPTTHCCHNHHRHQHHHYQYQYEPNNSGQQQQQQRLDSMIPVASLRQQCSSQSQSQSSTVGSHKNAFDLRMSSIQATTIISAHCNTDNSNSINSPNSTAITKLTASSNSGVPVTTLTVMDAPNLSTSRNGSYNWQAFMSTLKDRMATIFNCELLADVHFVVGKGNVQTRFPAHKFVLSIGSAVFDAMFNGPLTKAAKLKPVDSNSLSDSVSDTEIELPDIEPEAFEALLRFLYLDEVQIGPEIVMTTLYAAKKYEVPALEMACVDFLKANLSPENAFMLLTQARLFDEATLVDLCLETIDKHTMDSLHSDSFFDVDLDTLKLVVSRDSLRVREVSLFLAAIRWAEFECNRRAYELNADNKRKVLGDVLYLIRFPLMTIEEFAHNVAQSGVLTDKELVSLFLHFTVSIKPSLSFSLEPRCCITGEEYSVARFHRTESRWGYSGTSDRIRFLTDRPIFVIGFGLFGAIHGSSDYEAVIEVVHTGSGKVIASNTTSFVSDGSDSTFRVMFKYPVEISQNTNYTACATIKGVDSYYGTNGSRTVTVHIGKGDTKDAVTFQFSYAAGCNNGTSVEDGQIPEILFYI